MAWTQYVYLLCMQLAALSMILFLHACNDYDLFSEQVLLNCLLTPVKAAYSLAWA